MIGIMLVGMAFSSPNSTKNDDAHAKNKVEVRLNYRQLLQMTPEFQINDHDAIHPSQSLSDSRLRLFLDAKRTAFNVEMAGDITFGKIHGDVITNHGSTQLLPHRNGPMTGSIDDSMHLFTLRSANLQGAWGPIGYIAGLKTQHWGLGLISNNGEQSAPFGLSHYGDRVFRLGLKTKPVKPVTISLAFDRVIEDDMADWADDQMAIQGIFAAVYSPNKNDKLGLFTVYRHQKEADNKRETNGFLVDLHGKKTIKNKQVKLRLESEAACLLGDTSRFSNFDNPDELTIFGCGGALELESVWLNDTIGAMIRTVYASGDGNPNDKTLKRFSLDRDYNMGLLLFDHHRAAIELGLEDLLKDPAFSGVPPEGVEATTTNGSLHSLIAIQPVLSWKSSEKWNNKSPLSYEAKAGIASAWSTAPIAHAFYSYRNGGVNRNHLNEDTFGRLLGHEINWSLKGQSTKPLAKLTPSIQVMGAHALLSDDNGDEGLHMFTVVGHLVF